MTTMRMTPMMMIRMMMQRVSPCILLVYIGFMLLVCVR